MYGGMNRYETQGLLALVALIAVGVGAQTYLSHRREGAFWVERTNLAAPRAMTAGASSEPSPGPSVVSAPSYQPRSPIDINTAPAGELEMLPRIGAVRARAIVDYRTKAGLFSRSEDLLAVPGIGPKTLEGLVPLITLGAPEPTAMPAAPVGAEPAATPRPVPAPQAPALIDINTASAEELQNLANIGPARAQDIVAWRAANGRFRRKEDLLRVSGIGPKTLAGLRAEITVGGGAADGR